jgi:hypothetical protein
MDSESLHGMLLYFQVPGSILLFITFDSATPSKMIINGWLEMVDNTSSRSESPQRPLSSPSPTASESNPFIFQDLKPVHCLKVSFFFCLVAYYANTLYPPKGLDVRMAMKKVDAGKVILSYATRQRDILRARSRIAEEEFQQTLLKAHALSLEMELLQEEYQQAVIEVDKLRNNLFMLGALRSQPGRSLHDNVGLWSPIGKAECLAQPSFPLLTTHICKPVELAITDKGLVAG